VVLAALAIALGVFPGATFAADFFALPAFEQQWQADEARIPNYWGPLANSPPPLLEPYKGASTGPICKPGLACITIAYLDKRTVQYFDKGRMEQPGQDGKVTSGLLATELVHGKIQVGDTQFEDRTPPSIPIAGDPDNTVPTYLQLATTASSLLAPVPSKPGSFVTVFINAQGQVEDGGGFAGISMTPPVGAYDGVTQHNVLGVFADYRNQAGLLTIGYAISEPFRANVKVGGRQATVLIQVFERRVLTYNNANPDAFKVEMGNIGQHYYKWRYPTGPPADPGPGASAASGARDTAMQFFQTLQANGDPSQYFSSGAWDFYKNKLYQSFGVSPPLQSFTIMCDKDTQLQVGTPPVRDVIVTLTGNGSNHIIIVRTRPANGQYLIDGFVAEAASGAPLPANICSLP
jgi:hypothetical protein